MSEITHIGMSSALNTMEYQERSETVDRAESLKQAARLFEAYFVSSLLKEMRKTVPESGLLSSGPGKDIYNWMLDDVLAEKLSESGGLGLSKWMERKYQNGSEVD